MRMTTLGRRIQSVRSALGETQKQFAARFGVDQSTVSKWETDRQVPEPAHLDTIASLIDGDGDSIDNPDRSESIFRMVPMVGHIGAGGSVSSVDTESNEANTGYIRAPRGFGAVEALEVNGDFLYPVYRNGDIVYIERRSASLPLASGREYVIRLADGRILMKTVELSGDGSYALFAYNAPPERGVKIVDAHAVRYVRRA